MSIDSHLISYTAGLFDGEGSVQINAKRNKRKKTGCSYYWYLTFQISSGDYATLQELRNSWDLGATTNWKPKNGKRSYNWRAYSEEAGEIMRSILPYAKIKRDQLTLGLEFLKVSKKINGRLTKDTSKERTKIALQLQIVNQRFGKSKLKLSKEIYDVCH